jgi:hypothetical protein
LTVGPPYQTDRPCQSSSCRPAWTRTWRRNPNYRHGHWCRYRTRLEFRLARAQRRVRSYLSEAPKHAPFVQPDAWATFPPGVLPRRLWADAWAYLRQTREIAVWWGAWLRKLHVDLTPSRPLAVMAFLSTLFQIGQSP